jgi:hypothetical protein
MERRLGSNGSTRGCHRPTRRGEYVTVMKCIAPLDHAGYALIAAQPALRFVNPRSRYPNLAAAANDGNLISVGVAPDHVDVDAQARRDLAQQLSVTCIILSTILSGAPDQTAHSSIYFVDNCHYP